MGEVIEFNQSEVSKSAQLKLKNIIKDYNACRVKGEITYMVNVYVKNGEKPKLIVSDKTDRCFAKFYYKEDAEICLRIYRKLWEQLYINIL